MPNEMGMEASSSMLKPAISSLVPQAGNPFFIVSPPYTRLSAGVTVLHLLCHYLNSTGESAYMVQWPPTHTPVRSLPYYVTLQSQLDFPGGMLSPMITQEAIDFYHEREFTPIVIYPEVYDNPLKVDFFGRYILNYPGKLHTAYAERENFAVAYSRILADHCAEAYPTHPPIQDVLFVPTTDLNFWNKSGAAEVRHGSCFYAGKLRFIHGKAVDNVPPGSVEILYSNLMTRKEVRELFWRSEIFYCHEDSALALEALLCGCPVAFIPNELFSGRPLAAHEVGNDGWCIGTDPDAIAKARATIDHVEDRIQYAMASVQSRIQELSRKWKEEAKARKYAGSILCPYETRLVYFEQKLSSLPHLGVDDTDEPEDTPASMRSGLMEKATLPARLMLQTFRDKGASGVVPRVYAGIRRHGLFGFLRLLFGISHR